MLGWHPARAVEAAEHGSALQPDAGLQSPQLPLSLLPPSLLQSELLWL